MSGIEIKKTGDGSTTLFVPELNETYHSIHGAYNEAIHVFIEKGLRFVQKQKQLNTLKVFELGMGTGLNALLTYIESCDNGLVVEYDTVEAYPIDEEMLALLNFSDIVPGENVTKKLNQIHRATWGDRHQLETCFSLKKHHAKIEELDLETSKYDVIYFDAFAPNKQKELWEPAILGKIYSSMSDGGALVTYCAQGQFKRDLKSVGFQVEKVDGPPGKREMIRAVK